MSKINSSNSGPPPPPLPQRQLARNKAAKDRLGSTVQDRVGISIKDRLGKRTASRASHDSGVSSPTAMESTATEDPFSQPLVQTLCGQELDQSEVQETGSRPNLQSSDSAQESQDKDKNVGKEGEGEICLDDSLNEDNQNWPNLYADSPGEKKEGDVQEEGMEEEQKKDDGEDTGNGNKLEGIVRLDSIENKNQKSGSSPPASQEKIEPEKEKEIVIEKEVAAPEKTAASSAQDRLRKREKTSTTAQDRLKQRKDDRQKAKEKLHEERLAKLKIKREKIDESERVQDTLENFVWNETQVFDFLKTTITRPDQHPKSYSFSLFDKLDHAQIIENKVPCDGCKTPFFFYRFGDTISILLTTSTLAGMKHKDADRNRDYECSHFEYLVVRGGTFLDMTRIACPILKFLQGYFNVQVLIVCGINDLNDESLNKERDPFQELTKRVKNFNKLATTGISRQKIELDDQKLHPGDISVKYICIPYPPKFSRLRNETHPIKDKDRTDDIANLNRYFKKLNNESFPQRHVPTLEMIGISEEPLVKQKPVRNVHLYEEWHCGERKWPKDKRFAKDIVHLRYSARLIVWKAIHHYFSSVF